MKDKYKLSKKDLIVKLWSSGTKIVGGRIYDEYSDLLKNRQKRFQTYTKMDNDSSVFVIRDSINKAKQTAEVVCVPYTENKKKKPSKRDQQIAQIIEKNLFEMINDWRHRFQENITLYVRDWFSLFEYRFEQNQDWNRYMQLERISAESIEKRETQDGKPWITQMLKYSKAKTNEADVNVWKNTISIPAEKLLLFNINAEWQNYEWTSLYRKIVRDRYFKDKFETLDWIFQERFCVPPVKVKIPRGTADNKQEQYLEIAQNLYSSDHWAVVELYDANLEWNWVLPVVQYEVMKNDYADTRIDERIKRYDQNIKDVFYAQFLYLWKSEKWSYWMAWASKDFYMQAISSLLEYDLDIINQYIIPKIMVMNWFDVNRQPRLEFRKLWFVNTPQFSDNIDKLMSVKAITPTIETENYIREVVWLPKIEDVDYIEPTLDNNPQDPNA